MASRAGCPVLEGGRVHRTNLDATAVFKARATLSDLLGLRHACRIHDNIAPNDFLGLDVRAVRELDAANDLLAVLQPVAADVDPLVLEAF